MSSESRRFYPEAYERREGDAMRAFYDAWADTYDDEMVEENRYTGPRQLAEALALAVPDRQAWIIDVGCGTGLVGTILKELGFTNIDGLDLSRRMLEVAGRKEVYHRLVEGDLLHQIPLNSNRYDAAVSAGTFTHGHVGPDGLDEILRIVRPGGLALLMINSEMFVQDGFEGRMKAFETAGKAAVIDKSEQTVVGSTGVKSILVTLKIA